MFEVVFLGTAASVPTVARGLPALMVLHGRRRFLVDCGEGTQRQLLISGLGYRRLDTVLLTHGHLDHVLGLGGLAATFSEWAPRRRLAIYGGADALSEARRYLEHVILPEAGHGLEVDYRALAPGPVVDLGDLTIEAFRVVHRGTDSYGFVFSQPARRHFDETRAKALGIPEGAPRQHLAKGRDVTLADGRRIEAADVLGPARAGVRLAVVGDCGRTDDLVEVVAGVDGLVIEATYRDAERARARAFDHLTASEAAALARDAGVGALRLTHISARYQGPELEAEARTVFPAARVANDFERFVVTAKT